MACHGDNQQARLSTEQDKSFPCGKEPVEATDKPLTLVGGFAFFLFLENKKKNQRKNKNKNKTTRPQRSVVLYYKI